MVRGRRGVTFLLVGVDSFWFFFLACWVSVVVIFSCSFICSGRSFGFSCTRFCCIARALSVVAFVR